MGIGMKVVMFDPGTWLADPTRNPAGGIKIRHITSISIIFGVRVVPKGEGIEMAELPPRNGVVGMTRIVETIGGYEPMWMRGGAHGAMRMESMARI